MQSRRRILRLLTAGPLAFFFNSRTAAAMSPIDRIAAAWATRLAAASSRSYRADATVTFLGITVFSRANVGSATVALEEGNAREGARTVLLRFAAGSAPERTRGLNRLGYIEEFVVERTPGVVESAWFGFMSSSPEKNLDQARAALGPPSKDSIPYTAVEGSASNASSAYRLYEITLPASYNFSHCDTVVRQVRNSLSGKQLSPTRAESSEAVGNPQTFLYAVREAMRAGGSRYEGPFLYNGKRFLLDVERGPDPKTAQQLVSRDVAASTSRIVRLNGAVRSAESGEKTPFRLWFEEGSELPLRFEYRPRGYLNLAFEYVKG